MRIDDLFLTLPGCADALDALENNQEMATCPFTLAQLDMDHSGVDRDVFSYGEISMSAFATALFDGANATRDDSFLDLGSGSGRAVLAAGSLGLRRVAGIELLPSLLDLSRQAAQTAGAWPTWPAAVGRASLIGGNIFHVPWWSEEYWQTGGWGAALNAAKGGDDDDDDGDDGDNAAAESLAPSIVYVCATKFGGADVFAKLFECLRRLRDGTRIIIATQALHAERQQSSQQSQSTPASPRGQALLAASPRAHLAECFVEIWRSALPFTWGDEVVRVYRVAHTNGGARLPRVALNAPARMAPRTCSNIG